jgi:2-oxoglutarate/2-oxoacid ferredoxin oxidoreductase subunit beta
VRQRSDGTVEIADVAETGEEGLLVHDETLDDPSLAFTLSRLAHTPVAPTPIGIFRAVERPVYDALMQQQLDDARKDKGEGDLAALLHAGDTWTIS